MSTAILPFFPSLVHYTDIENFSSIKDELVDYVYQERKEDVEGRVISNAGGWQSNELNHKGDNILKRVIASGLREIFNPTDFQPVAYEMQSLWININRRGDSNLPHDHPLSNVAGVFWIKSPPGCGTLEFQSPHHFTSAAEIEMYTEEFQEKSGAYPFYMFPPTEGTILLFPASLIHRVDVCQSNEDRISAAFNLTFKL